MPWSPSSNLPFEPALDLLSKSWHKTPQVVVRYAAKPVLAKQLSD